MELRGEGDERIAVLSRQTMPDGHYRVVLWGLDVRYYGSEREFLLQAGVVDDRPMERRSPLARPGALLGAFFVAILLFFAAGCEQHVEPAMPMMPAPGWPF